MACRSSSVYTPASRHKRTKRSLARALGCRSGAGGAAHAESVGRDPDRRSLGQIRPNGLSGVPPSDFCPVPLVRQPVQVDQDRTPRAVMALDESGLLEGRQHLLHALRCGAQDTAQVGRAEPVPGSPSGLGAVGHVATSSRR